jgi:hypothetical protein
MVRCEKTTQEQETKQKRPSTAPSKRLLSSSTPSGGRPRSARNDSTSHSVNILTDESENKESIIYRLKKKLINTEILNLTYMISRWSDGIKSHIHYFYH